MDTPINKSDISVNKIKELHLCDYYDISQTLSETSIEVTEEQSKLEIDSGIMKTPLNNEILSKMEKRFNDLYDVIVEQSKILATIKEDLKASKTFIEKSENTNVTIFEDALKKILAERIQELIQLHNTEVQGPETNLEDPDQATALLNPIELKTQFSIDQGIKNALKNLLQSDELKEKLVPATISAIEEMVTKIFSKDFADVYTSVLVKMQRRLQSRVIMILEDCFSQIEENTNKYLRSFNVRTKHKQMKENLCWLREFSNIKKQVYKTVGNTVTQILEKEIAQWHSRIYEVITDVHKQMLMANHDRQKDRTSVYSAVVPPSPVNKSLRQPTEKEDTTVDRLMKSASFVKQLEDGEVNEAFSNALQARDLYLVIVVCRAADPTKVFGEPCFLKEPTILSLAQQLSTDLIYDTQLQCSYLECAVRHWTKMKTEAREYLPLVANEVSNNLVKFIETYPCHAANRKIIIIMENINKITRKKM